MVKKEEPEKTAAPPTGDTGEQEERLTRAEADALVTEKTKGLERAVSEKAEQIQRLEASRGDWQSEIQTLRQDMTQNMQLMAAMAYEGRPPEAAEDLSSTERGDALKKTQAFIAQEAAKTEAKRKEQDYFRKADAIYAKAEKLYGDDIDALHNIRNLIRNRDLDLAEKKIAKAETKVVEPEVKESEEDKRKAIDEAARKMLEDTGQLKTDTGGPSAGGEVVSVASLQVMMTEPAPKGQKALQAYQEKIDKAFEAWKEGRLK